MNKALQAIALILYAPMIFLAMYLDYHAHVPLLHLAALLYPALFLRRTRWLLAGCLLSVLISSWLSQLFLQNTDVFFTPFDKMKPVLIAGESLLFLGVQWIFIQLTGKLWNAYKRRGER